MKVKMGRGKDGEGAVKKASSKKPRLVEMTTTSQRGMSENVLSRGLGVKASPYLSGMMN